MYATLYEKPKPRAIVLICFAVNESTRAPLIVMFTALPKLRPEESICIIYFSEAESVAYFGSDQLKTSALFNESAGVGAIVVVELEYLYF